MKWKFWKKNSKSDLFYGDYFKPAVSTMSMSSLFRWYCYDLSVKDVHDLSLKLGLTPISKEAEETEIQESNKRIAELGGLMPFLQTMAEINTGVMVESSSSIFDTSPMTEEQKEKIRGLISNNFYLISLSALISTFSSAMALNLIHKGPIVATEVYGEDE